MDENELIVAFKALGHIPKVTDRGAIDWFAMETDAHHGPACAVCGESFCRYCVRNADDLLHELGPCIGTKGVKKREAKYHQQRIENAVKLLQSEGFTVKPPKAR